MRLCPFILADRQCIDAAVDCVAHSAHFLARVADRRRLVSIIGVFFVELVIAPIWSVPMDIAPRYAGSASSIMNFGFGMAGIISPWVFGYTIDLTGSWTLPFLGSIALLLVGAGLALRLRPDQQLLDQAVPKFR